MYRQILTELSTRSDEELAMLLFLFKTDSLNILARKMAATWKQTTAEMPISRYMNGGCINRSDPATQDDDPENVIMTSNGVCWDPESLARYIITRNGDQYLDDGVRGSLAQDIGERLKEIKIYDKTILDQLMANRTLDDNLKTELRDATTVRVEDLPKELMEFVLKTGQILQNAGPAWNEVFDRVLSANSENGDALRQEWSRVVSTSTLLEPPRNMSGELDDMVTTIKSEAFNNFYDTWNNLLSPAQQSALVGLNQNLTAEKLNLCRRGQECMKLVSTSLMSAYNKWAAAVKETEYAYGSGEAPIPARPLPTNVAELLARYGEGERSFPGIQLRWMLNEKVLSGCDFSNATVGALIVQTGFEGAIFNGANFQGGSCVGCRFMNAQLRNCSMIGADFRGSKFNSAYLTGATMSSDFTNVDFADANFTSATLSGSTFEGANLKRVNFTGAVLSGTTFKKTNLKDVNFGNADLRDANLRGSVGLSTAQKQEYRTRGALL